MPNHRRKLLPLCIAASLLSGLSMQTAAIGVGEIRLQSFLGAPLQAEVPLSHLGDLSVDQLKVQLGEQGDYSAMGVDYTYLHSQLKIEPFLKNGQTYVRISTQEPIVEPYLNFVLSLRWPQGQLVREFTVLLDPPAPAVATVSPDTDALAQEPVAAAETPAAPKSRRQTRRVSPPAEVAEVVPGEGRYTIRRGDSLWRIANRVRPARVPVEQVMTAIQSLNPSAFINGDPGLLKESVTIALPDAQQIAAAANAENSVAIAEPVAPAVESVAASNVTSATGAPVAAELIEENSALKAQVTDLTSNVAVLNQNLVQSEQRLHQLEAQLNELIQQMQQQRATVAALSGSAESAPIAQSTGSVINQVNASELHGPAQAHTPWWVHLLYWLGIGGAVTWAVREHFWPQRRLATAGIATVATGYEKTPAVATSMTRAAVTPAKVTTVQDAAELTLDLDELPLPVASASADTEPAPQLLHSNDDPVDASISAGVFVAFGRFSEAESMLREALAREPARIDLKLQLLDVLMQSDQPGAFDDLAEEIENEAHTPEDLAELAVLRDSYRTRH